MTRRSGANPTVNAEILGQLAPRDLVLAYGHGAFPMVERGDLFWFSPDPRGLLPVDERFHVPRRLKRTLRGGRFVCTVNRRFDAVVRSCADRPGGETTWISPEIRLAYGRLHELGLAHSVEAWPAGAVGAGVPAGGCYGVALGGAFFAESMFHRATDAGKVALVRLIERLRDRGFAFCDIQWVTDNLSRYGAFEVARVDYVPLLNEALGRRCRFD